MKYRLDLATLLQVLHQSTGKLESKSVHLVNVKGNCQLSVWISHGSILECMIIDNNGTIVFQGGDAFKLVENLVIEWDYIAEKISEPSRASSSPYRQFTPKRPETILVLCRARYVSQQEFLSWPRLYRNIYFLTEKPTTVDHVTMILTSNLQQRPEQVMEIIADFIRQGVLQQKAMEKLINV